MRWLRSRANGWQTRRSTATVSRSCRPFFQPPVTVLEQMVAVRLQLDDNAADTGPLEVVPGSHVMGRLSSEAIRAATVSGKVPCVVERGGVVVLRPLLIHSSAKGRSAGSRRVLHFLYGPPLLSALES